MKICIECDFAKEQSGFAPNGQMIKDLICENPECRDPVAGDSLPCGFARREIAFCGITGKYFKLKEVKESAPVIQLVQP